MLKRLLLLLLVILALALPFELKNPIGALGSIRITDVELILYALVAMWFANLLSTRRMTWTVAHSAVLAWLAIQFLAAIFAPLEREAAIKFALRSAGGAALFFVAADSVRTSRVAAWLMVAIALGAVISSLAGIAEVASSSVQQALLIFKTQLTLVGGHVRASGTFQYANIAAMYWEAALPILLAGGAWWSSANGRRRGLLLAVIAAFAVIEAIVLSASRTAVVSAALGLVLVIVLERAAHLRSGLARSGAISLIGLIFLVGAALLGSPVYAARLRSEGDAPWFRAVIRPARSNVVLAAGQVITDELTLSNSGLQTWPAAGARPVHVSYHWIDPATERMIIVDGLRTALPHDLAPGETLALAAHVRAPAKVGTYVLQWDLVQEDVIWFSERGSAVAEVKAQVTPTEQTSFDPLPPSRELLIDATPPSRRELWSAGLEMWAQYPLLGIGPDNFRHIYGRYLGRAVFDDSLTANNWYVEALANTGLLGLAALVLLVAALAYVIWRKWGTLPSPERILALGLGLALVMFFVHGVLDYFMEFTPTYGLFWLIAGTLIGLLTGTHDVEFRRTTHRI